MRVTEIFHSIQGESSYVGQPCVFVRLTGCPLRCTWCASDYAFYGGNEVSLEDIVSTVASYRCSLVEVTGGEPLAHVILDVKCPGSGMTDRLHWSNLAKFTAKDEAKFVVSDRKDYEWARDVIARHDMASRCSVL